MVSIPHLPFGPFSTGDTLLAIRAPNGTQLEVPIPESVSYMCDIFFSSSCCCVCRLRERMCFLQILNGQRKYQIRLKSSTGPIEVLLVNKDPSSAAPVVVPVPPPDDVLQSLPTPTATPTSQPTTAASQVPTGFFSQCSLVCLFIDQLITTDQVLRFALILRQKSFKGFPWEYVMFEIVFRLKQFTLVLSWLF